MKKFCLLACFILGALAVSCDMQEDELQTPNDGSPSSEAVYVSDNFNLDFFLESTGQNIATRSAGGPNIMPASYPTGVTEIFISPSTNTFPGIGGSVTIYASGTVKDPIPVRAYNYMDRDHIIFSGEIPVGTNPNVTLNIPPFYDMGDGVPLMIMVEYYTFPAWAYLHFYLQPASEQLFKTDIDMYIPAEGGVYTITPQDSNIPGVNESVSFRAIDNNGVQVATSVIVNPFVPVGRLEIPANESEEVLQITLQYLLPGSNEWRTFEEWIQVAPGYGAMNIREGMTFTHIIPAGGEQRVVYLKKGEGLDKLSDVKLRARSSDHAYYGEIIGDEVFAIDNPVSLGPGYDYDGYANIPVPIAVPAPYNGWAHGAYSTISKSFHQPNTGMGEFIFEYWNGTEWIPLCSAFQRPYFLRAQYLENNVTALGGRLTLAIAGYWPDGDVLFKTALANGTDGGVSQGKSYEPDYQSESPSFNGRVSMDVLPNLTGSPKQIYIWFSINGGATWERWENSDPKLADWILPSTYPIYQPSY